MELISPILQTVCVLAAAAVLGNWFLAERKKALAAAKPWYAAYLSTPGILIICIVLLLPLVAHLKQA